jgi:cellulase
VNGNIPAASTCAVSAGDKLAVEMHQQPGDRSCSTDAIGGDHFGPTLIYMAKVSSAATATTPWTAGWFKVNNTGLITANPQYWATQDMNANCGKVYFTVPHDIAPGDYLVRAEVIALHVAGSVGGAQYVPPVQCCVRHADAAVGSTRAASSSPSPARAPRRPRPSASRGPTPRLTPAS